MINKISKLQKKININHVILITAVIIAIIITIVVIAPEITGLAKGGKPGKPGGETPTESECSDGVDNDGDGLIDSKDPGCLCECGGSGPAAFCGDGVCDSDETCEICSDDCGTCPVNDTGTEPPVNGTNTTEPPASVTCTNHAQCSQACPGSTCALGVYGCCTDGDIGQCNVASGDCFCSVNNAYCGGGSDNASEESICGRTNTKVCNSNSCYGCWVYSDLLNSESACENTVQHYTPTDYWYGCEWAWSYSRASYACVGLSICKWPGSPASCGDGNCDTNENCLICQYDCGVCMSSDDVINGTGNSS